MRHTFLTTAGVSGTDIFKLKKIAGYASVTTTERYIHPSQEAVQAAFERIRKMRESAQNRKKSAQIPAQVSA
jgi:site-specific recombinase XerD